MYYLVEFCRISAAEVWNLKSWDDGLEAVANSIILVQ